MGNDASPDSSQKEGRKRFLTKKEDAVIRLVSIGLGVLLYLSIVVLLKKNTTMSGNISDMGVAYVVLLQLLPVFGGYFFSKWYLTNRQIDKNIQKYHRGLK